MTTADLLINEINKPKNNFIYRHKASSFGLRDINLIIMLLKELPGFQLFMKYNHIEEESLKIAANLINYKFIPKNEYIFRESQESDRFYGIIKGRVSIRRIQKQLHFNEDLAIQTGRYSQIIELKRFISTNTTIPKQKLSNVSKEIYKEIFWEEEVIQINDGHCFGEWGLINKRNRTSSAFTIEDTYLFFLDKESFMHSFMRSLAKAEADRKSFILDLIPPLKDISNIEYDILYKSMITLFLSKGELIYYENTEADRIFIVYQGCCKIEKNVLEFKEKREPSPNKPDSKVNLEDYSKIKFATLLRLDPGNIVGLESLYDIPKYKYTLKSDNEFSVILSLRVEKLNPRMKEKFQIYFKYIYMRSERTLQEISDKKKEYKNKMKITYKDDIMVKQLNFLKMTKREEMDLNNNIQNQIKDILSVRPSPKNNLHQYSISLTELPITRPREKQSNKELVSPSKSSIRKSVLMNDFLRSRLKLKSLKNLQYIQAQNSAEKINQSLINKSSKSLTTHRSKQNLETLESVNNTITPRHKNQESSQTNGSIETRTPSSNSKNPKLRQISNDFTKKSIIEFDTYYPDLSSGNQTTRNALTNLHINSLDSPQFAPIINNINFNLNLTQNIKFKYTTQSVSEKKLSIKNFRNKKNLTIKTNLLQDVEKVKIFNANKYNSGHFNMPMVQKDIK